MRSFEAVFTDLQRDAQDPVNLANWARANLTEFYKLAARLIPTNIAGELHTDTRLIING